MTAARALRILAITTSTRRGGAALLAGDALVAAASYDDERGHAERIFSAIDEVLAKAGLDKGDLDAIACDVGPGSFTGVRVGVAAAKGIAMALGVSLYGATSLEAMAAAARAGGAASPGDLVVPLVDAKKGEVFTAAYAEEGAVFAELRHLARGDVDAFASSLGEALKPVLVGEIAREIDGLSFANPSGFALDLPSAEWVARLAALRAKGGVADPEALEATYVRAPDAKPSA